MSYRVNPEYGHVCPHCLTPLAVAWTEHPARRKTKRGRRCENPQCHYLARHGEKFAVQTIEIVSVRPQPSQPPAPPAPPSTFPR